MKTYTLIQAKEMAVKAAAKFPFPVEKVHAQFGVWETIPNGHLRGPFARTTVYDLPPAVYICFYCEGGESFSGDGANPESAISAAIASAELAKGKIKLTL